MHHDWELIDNDRVGCPNLHRNMFASCLDHDVSVSGANPWAVGLSPAFTIGYMTFSPEPWFVLCFVWRMWQRRAVSCYNLAYDFSVLALGRTANGNVFVVQHCYRFLRVPRCMERACEREAKRRGWGVKIGVPEEQ